MILREAQKATIQRSAYGRENPRRDLKLQTGGLAEGGVADVLIHNLSTTGALIATSATLEAGDRIDIDLPHAGSRAATIVWSDDGIYGCRFEQPLTKAAISASLLRADRPAPSPTPEQLAELLADVDDADYASDAPLNDDRLHPAMRLLALTVLTLACWAAILGIVLLLT